MAVNIIQERRKKTKAMVTQQRHRRRFWWNKTAEERAGHLGWCPPCRLHYQAGK